MKKGGGLFFKKIYTPELIPCSDSQYEGRECRWGNVDDPDVRQLGPRINQSINKWTNLLIY